MELEHRTGPELTGVCWGVARGVELPCPMVAIKSGKMIAVCLSQTERATIVSR